jgi:hypothetical protein
MRLCQFDRGQAGFKIKRWDEDPLHSKVDRAPNNGLAVFVKFIEIQVAVGICKHKLIVKIIT